MSKFELVKQYLHDMEIPIVSEDPDEELVVVDKEDDGIKNMVIDCEDPILVIEQIIMKVPESKGDLYEKLLKWNREVIHGAFALDNTGQMILYRDTLQLENLDRNELEASIQSLSLAMAEYSSDLIQYAKK